MSASAKHRVYSMVVITYRQTDSGQDDVREARVVATNPNDAIDDARFTLGLDDSRHDDRQYRITGAFELEPKAAADWIKYHDAVPREQRSVVVFEEEHSH